ncbi:hypothetical protein M2T38_26325, partial [Klebsiella pneumoniae]|nr:hypothetical protein [Klebsiella pneumoniae]
HEQYVPIITAPCAADVCVGEAIDCRIGIIITGTGVPTVNPGVRTGLNHAVGNYCAGKSMSMSTGTDERVDVSTIVFYISGGCTGAKCE